MYLNPYTPIGSLEVDPDIWMLPGFVTVPLSDPEVQKQLESGIHLFLQWFTNTLYLHCPSSHIHASTPRYVDKNKKKKQKSEKHIGITVRQRLHAVYGYAHTPEQIGKISKAWH